MPKLNEQRSYRQHIEIRIQLLFFTKIGQWQHLLELIVASNVLAMV
jgi:hypothetical protein